MNRRIAYIINDKYAPFALVSLTSLMKHGNARGRVPVRVYEFGLSPEWRRRLETIGGAEIAPIPAAARASGAGDETVQRLAKTHLFDESADCAQTLFLDADTLVLGDLSEAFDILDGSDAVFAAVPEWNPPGAGPLKFFFSNWRGRPEGELFERASELLGVAYPGGVSIPYFNGGVICAKPGKWANIWREILLKTKNAPDANPCDSQLALQAALIRAGARVLPLDPSWNFNRFTWNDARARLWNIAEASPDCRELLHPEGGRVPLRVLHAVGAVAWSVPVVHFPAHWAYVHQLMSILYGHPPEN